MYSLIKKVVCCPGVSGNEKQIAALLEKEVAPFVDETYTDALGNLIGSSGRGVNDQRVVGKILDINAILSHITGR